MTLPSNTTQQQWASMMEASEPEAPPTTAGTNGGGQWFRITVPSHTTCFHAGKAAPDWSYPGVNFITDGNFYASAAQVALLQSNMSMGFQANEAIYQLTNSDLDVYGRASVNLGAKGGVVLASIASSAAKVEIVPEAGGEVPATTTHTQFVSDRNKVYNSIQTQKNWANAIAGSIMGVKTVLGLPWPSPIWLTRLASSLSTLSSMISVATAWVNVGFGAGTLKEAEAAPGNGLTTTGEMPTQGAGASKGDPSFWEAAYHKPIATEAKNEYGVVNAGTKGGFKVATGEMELNGRQSSRDLHVSNEHVTNSQSNLNTATETHNTNTATYNTLQNDTANKQTAFNDLRNNPPADNHPTYQAQLQAAQSELAAAQDAEQKFAKTLAQSSESLSEADQHHTSTTGLHAENEANKTTPTDASSRSTTWKKVGAGFDVLGAAVGLYGAGVGMWSALTAKKKSAPPGVAIFSEADIFLGNTKIAKSLTAVAPGGFTFIAPQIAGFSILVGTTISIQTALKTEVFSLLSVTFEGGMNAEIVATGSTGVTSRMREVNVVGKEIKIGAQAGDVPKVLLSFKANPAKQRPTQEVMIRTTESGQIDIYVHKETKHVSLTPTKISFVYKGNKFTLDDNGVTIESDTKIDFDAPTLELGDSGAELAITASKTTITGDVEVKSPSNSTKVSSSGVETEAGAKIKTAGDIKDH